ncbi:hypothetical protein CSC29_1047 [Pseudomonas aeruginosa]|nr:hypothetical protein CSB90_5103 [Pseudomonas aeruginosa]AWE92373.1 hypothetical protein CSC28_1879 [Pseudomonas paraeruginosa]SMZ49731.1 hypothetical protein PANN_18940 [Pseudomonas aeruginosa C-NN2]AVK27866.1 hypothetical protein CSB85_0507 [Pseudomonas aeruginosa]AWE82656.1 hypothetical protein CSC29_1047 [Pseudomonas aeruginosa]
MRSSLFYCCGKNHYISSRKKSKHPSTDDYVVKTTIDSL